MKICHKRANIQIKGDEFKLYSAPFQKSNLSNQNNTTVLANFMSIWHRLGISREEETPVEKKCFIRSVWKTYSKLVIAVAQPTVGGVISGLRFWVPYETRWGHHRSKAVNSTLLCPLCQLLSPGSAPVWDPALTLGSDGLWLWKHKSNKTVPPQIAFSQGVLL